MKGHGSRDFFWCLTGILVAILIVPPAAGCKPRTPRQRPTTSPPESAVEIETPEVSCCSKETGEWQEYSTGDVSVAGWAPQPYGERYYPVISGVIKYRCPGDPAQCAAMKAALKAIE